MTDINELVDRLNNERSVYDAELCDEAADRIEELEAHGAANASKLARYIAENERLRDALELAMDDLTGESWLAADLALRETNDESHNER